MRLDLKALCELLQSDKAKERQEGIAGVRQVFDRAHVVQNFDDGSGKVWLVLFQSLFDAVDKERKACVKNSTPVALRRLQDAVSVLRWLVERSVSVINNYVLRPLVQHLMQMISFRGSLFAHIAPDYVKTLVTLLQRGTSPHLDYIGLSMWESLISIAFSILLDQPMTIDIFNGNTETTEEEEEDEEEEEEEEQTDADAGRKRSRGILTSGLAKKRAKTSRRQTQEQIDAAALIRILVDSRHLPCAGAHLDRLLRYLSRFFSVFPTESTAHRNMILALNTVLLRGVLNARDCIARSTSSLWDTLMTLWCTKDRATKEAIVVTVQTLLPFIEDTRMTDGLTRLFNHIDAEPDSRAGAIPILRLDALRLELYNDDDALPIFFANSFRAGPGFHSAYAISWAALELQADCLCKLHMWSEYIEAMPKQGSPVTSFLGKLQTSSSADKRYFRLQTLLFLIDRHWKVLHTKLQQAIVTTLRELLSLTKDEQTQTWVFLCLAGLAMQTTTVDVDWDDIWTRAIRRVGASRAACHCAHTLLARGRPSQARVLLELETFARDLEIQGPSTPSDAACALVSLSLSRASADARLYRMQFEEHALSWFTDAWRRSQAAPRDALKVLEAICSLSRRSDVLWDTRLPYCDIVQSTAERRRTAPIRDFMLYARLPSPRVVAPSVASSFPENVHYDDLAQPRPRERKCSSFLQKTLESLPSLHDGVPPTAEQVRAALDVAVIALCFEASLEANGTRATRKVVEGASLVIHHHILAADVWRWTWADRAQVFQALAPLVRIGNERDLSCDPPVEILVPPGSGSGIERNKLSSLRPPPANSQIFAARRHLQHIIWRSADVQDQLKGVLDVMRKILEKFLSTSDSSFNGSHPERDTDFGPVRMADPAEPGESATSFAYYSPLSTRSMCLSYIVNFVAVAPMLHSQNALATRDKGLLDLILRCTGSQILQLGPSFCACVASGAFYLGKTGLSKLEKYFTEGLMSQYAFAKNDEITVLFLEILDASFNIWFSPQCTDDATGIRTFCKFLASSCAKHSWRVRDRWVQFAHRCVTEDPEQKFWITNMPSFTIEEEVKGANIPASSIVLLIQDNDIIIRARAGVASANLLEVADVYAKNTIDFYDSVLLGRLGKNLQEFELILTRILTLSNYVTVNSAVRRGPLWHLLEACAIQRIPNQHQYLIHIQASLENVAQRLGMGRLSDLFEAYSLALANSFLTNEQDMFVVPPQVLGYNGRREFAEASFATAAPVLLMHQTQPQRGRHSFLQYCEILGMTPRAGLADCFSYCLGLELIFWIQTWVGDGDMSAEQSTALRNVAIQRASQCTSDDPATFIAERVDGIASAIVRTLGDIDFRPTGCIANQLRMHSSGSDGERMVKTFNHLMQYRSETDFPMHSVNEPSTSTSIVLKALDWLKSTIPSFNADQTIYHVMHQLFASVHTTPLLNEKLRILHGLCVWVALYNRRFSRPALFRTLVLGSTILLGFPDLARIAQSILGWAFMVYRVAFARNPDPVFPDAVSRMGRIAFSFANDSDDRVLNGLGSSLLECFEQHLEDLATNEGLRDQVVTIVHLWPRRPSHRWVNLGIDSQRTDTLSTILKDPRLTSNKFKLVRRLRDFALNGTYRTESFSTSDFWLIKSCMPNIENLLDDDIDAFIDLLFLSEALLVPVTDRPPPFTSVAERHRSEVGPPLPDGTIPEEPSPKGSVLQALLAMLTLDNSSTVHLAYCTLRLVVPLKPPDVKLPFDGDRLFEKDEIAYLSHFRPAPHPRPSRDVSLLCINPEYVALASDFSTWICNVGVLLADSLFQHDIFWGQLHALLERERTFAEAMFPVLVHAVLAHEQAVPSSKKGTGTKSALSEFFAGVLKSPESHTFSVRSIVRTVLHLRNFRPPRSGDVLGYEKWLDLDYDLLARGAISCGAYTTALLFLELSAEFSTVDPAPTPPEDVLYEVYSRIDEPDGFYGIKSKDVLNLLVRRFHHEHEWDKAFHFHGARFEGTVGDSHGILHSLHSFGFDNLAMTVSQSVASPVIDLNFGHKIGWRTDTWDLPDAPSSGQADMSLYRCLRAVHRDRNKESINQTMLASIRNELSNLRSTGDENLVQIRAIVQTLMCLREIGKWQSPATQEYINAKNFDACTWKDLTLISPHFDFQDLESIMATRMSLLRSVRHREQRDQNQMGNKQSQFVSSLMLAESHCLVTLSEAARSSQHSQIALNSILKAQQLERSTQGASFTVTQELASVLWMQKEQKTAIEYLRGQLKERHPNYAKPTDDLALDTQRATILAQVGGWASEARLQKPVDIREEYFDVAANLLVGHSSTTSKSPDPAHATIFYQYAVFAEHHYHTILESPEVSQLVLYKKRKTEELKLLQRHHSSSGDQQQQMFQQTRKAKALLELDSTQLDLFEKARNVFRTQAVEMFSRCLCTSDEYDDDAVIRLCSIWTANFQLDDNAFHGVVETAIGRVPSRKFTFLAHQLSARLSKEHDDRASESKSQSTLQSLMWRLCSEHPFHSLYQLFSLQRAADAEPAPRRRSTSSAVAPALLARANAAADLSNKLQNAETTRVRTLDVERLCHAYLEWAQYPLKGKPQFAANAKQKAVPSHLQIHSLKVVKVPVTTLEIIVDPLLRYDDIIFIHEYAKTFDTAGGINLPKITDCTGSDGVAYKQLFKGEGNDDLRQDAVMEQVFQLCNKVLKKDRETAKRKLLIRPYKVIPLSPKAGMLEFVDQTLPLGSWIPKAHSRYHKDDMSSSAAQDTLKRVQNQALTPAAKAAKLLEAFLTIRKKCRPVMRFFFREYHKDPMAWFGMRLNYARSAATTSIIGHVLGLGDRHISNILIDKKTGELIHIDLGIAFEQGKLLPIPETVPFRLTADIVDGLGTAGPEGVFRRCAEHTLRVLHNDSDVIKLVLEVFKHDPLHSWYAGVKLRQAQQDVTKESAPQTDRFGIGIHADSNPEIEAADRALSSVARKLDKTMSVEYTVNELITTAMDPANLSRIFWGWNPQY